MDEELRQILENIEKRLTALEGRQHPALIPPAIPIKYEENVCTECGLRLEGVMGYCCPNPRCPTGLGPTMCGFESLG